MTNLVARDIERAADAVRSANHATMRGALDGPQSAVVVGNLVELAQRLPQVLDFLSRSLRRADPVEHYDDRGADAAWLRQLAGAEVDDARAALGDAAGHLTHAHNHLGHLGRRLSED